MDAPNDDRSHDLPLTKGTHYYCAIEAHAEGAHDLHDLVSEAPSHSEKQNLLDRGGEERAAGRTVEREVSLAENELGGEDELREVRLLETEEQIQLTDIAEKDLIDGTELNWRHWRKKMRPGREKELLS
ncbi:hypothetical protein R1sor_014011 [Riccia sorocarpa]|uniref:Uncharacterized protein n=1 Tax=Riccia sorocarpa TaxID=122646 RepID=A0ABD3HB72_9MARC